MGEARGTLQINKVVTASFDVLSQYLSRMTEQRSEMATTLTQVHCCKLSISGKLAIKLQQHHWNYYDGLTLPTSSSHIDGKDN
jgi:hypothetical protein